MDPKKILIVDDEKFVTDTLGGFFRGKGYSIFKAEDGNSALDTIKTESLNLVLLDIKLPKVDGVEILKILRRDYSAVKVIVMTAYDLKYKNRIDEIGYDAFFLKPLLIDELIKKVEELLSGDKMISKVTEPRIKSIPHRQEKPQVIDLEKALPKVRLLIISVRSLISSLLKDYFSNKELCSGIYEVTESGLEQLGYIKKFQPDIILLDIALVGMLGEFGLSLLKLPQPPKEIILFGDPAMKWEEVEALVKRGIKFIEMSEDFSDERYPIKETVERLNNAVRETCLRYGLYKKETD